MLEHSESLGDYASFNRALLTMVSGELRFRQRALEELYGVLSAGGLPSVTEAHPAIYNTIRGYWDSEV